MLHFFTKIVRVTGRGLALQECLYGFIMVLLFVFAALFGVLDIHDKKNMIMLILGMNVTWGIIDMIVYYLVDRSEQNKYIRIIKGESQCTDKREAIKANLSATVADIIDEKDEDRIVDIIMESNLEPEEEIMAERRGLLKSAFMCFIITVLTTIPAVVSLLIVSDLRSALITAAVSSSICMFFIGYGLGPYLGLKGWQSGSFILILTLGITLAGVFTGG